MNATSTLLVPVKAHPYDIEIPDWLQCCLAEHQPSENTGFLCSTASPEGPFDARGRDLICRAFQFAYCLHEGQRRASGEPYIAHPVAVAGLLRDLGGSPAVIAAGFLHDVVEDTEVTVEDIERRFGAEVSQLVEGVTKLSKFNFSSKTEQQAENFRRMFLAMAQDIRVILVKLADRLHNMRTLEHLKDEKRRRIAQETLDIFAPLANRLGIGRIKWELEDLSFKYLQPEAYREIQMLVAEKRTDREVKLQQAITVLRERLEQSGIEIIDLSGRPKHLYSIYRKMQRQNKSFGEIYDIAALRVIVSRNDECYRTLAIAHDEFRPIPGRFKDYIGLPKPNRYQSLHTSVIGFTGHPLEIQIRTLEMHHVAEYGIAAHWKYKESGGSQAKVSADDEKFTWLRQLLEWQSDLKDAEEYLESVRDNLFDQDIYVFTPRGDVIALAQGATPVDFAYHIHSEVGNRCAGAKVNNRMVPLDTILNNGDIVEIITQKNAHPSLDWISFVATSGAKNRIRHWFKRFHREENISRGRDMLERELGKTGFDALMKSGPMKQAAERCNYTSVEDLLAGVGYGGVTTNQVVNRLREIQRQQQPIEPMPMQTNSVGSRGSVTTASIPQSPQSRTSDSPILGIEGMAYRLAGCCNPLPGEDIIAVVSLGGHGLSIHRQGCGNLEGIPGDRLIPVSWNTAESKAKRVQTFPVRLQVEAIDRVGLMRDVLTRLSDNNINVRNANVTTAPNRPAVIEVCIDISNCEQLGRVMTQLKKMSDVLGVRRVGEARCED